MLRYWKIVCCALLSLVLAQSVRAVDSQITVIEVDAANPPFMYGSASSAKGIYPALIETVFGMIGTPVSLSAKPWRRVLRNVDLGRAGVAGIYKNQQRSQKLDFSEPLFSERIMVFYNRQHPVKVQGLADLEGKHIGVLAGWSYGDAFDLARQDNHFTVSEANSDAQNMAKLAAGRLDLVLAVEETGSAQVNLAHSKQINMLPVPLFKNLTYLAFNKKVHATLLLQRFNAGLQELKETPQYNLIVKNALSAHPR